jgi:DNA polymerase
LVDGEDPHVFSSGKVPSKIMIFAEAPGREESIQKIPLIGKSGQFFDSKILTGAKLQRMEVYVSNIIKCRPTNNRTPINTEIEMCNVFLDEEICLNDPQLIITLGNVPLTAICNVKGITKYRGNIMKSKSWTNKKQYNVFPMFHPSYCLRGLGLKEMSEDIER